MNLVMEEGYLEKKELNYILLYEYTTFSLSTHPLLGT